MKNFLTFLSLVAVLLGCGDKKQIIHKPLKNEILIYTSKAEVIEKNGHTLIIATYLNPIYQSKISIKNEEKFLVAINPKEHIINEQSIALNDDSNGLKARLVQAGDELLEFAGFNMPWSVYYEISAPSKAVDNLKLTFEIYPSKKVELDFVKNPKSLYWNY